jgi:hypothetical protein
MKRSQSIVLLLLVPCLLVKPGCSLAQSIVRPVSELQQTYVGHKAYLNLSTISCWHKVVDVVSITALPDPQVPTVTNALGEQIPQYTPDKRVQITVRCPDGSVGTHDVLQTYISSALLSPEMREKQIKENIAVILRRTQP